jgi:hypothetical protein
MTCPNKETSSGENVKGLKSERKMNYETTIEGEGPLRLSSPELKKIL